MKRLLYFIALLIGQFPFFLVSMALIAMVYLRRYTAGLGFDAAGAAILISLSIYLQLVPSALVRVMHERETLRWLNLGEINIICLMAFFVVGFYFGPLGGLALLLGSALICAAALKIKNATIPLPSVSLNPGLTLLTLLGFILAAAPIFYFIVFGWLQGYYHPFFDEFIGLHQNGATTFNRDVYAQLSYMAMLDHYGVFAAGVHGLHPLKFQLGGHLLTAAFDRMIGRDAAFFYNFATLCVVYPTLLTTMYGHILALTKVDRLVEKLGIFILLVSATIGFVPQATLNKAAFWSEISLVNIPSTFGYWFLFIYISCLFVPSRSTPSVPEGLFIRVVRCCLLSVFLAWLCFAKAPIGLGAVMVFAVWFLLRVVDDYRTAPYPLACCSVVAVLFIAWWSRQRRSTWFQQDIFMDYYSKLPLRQFYEVYFHHVWIFCTIALLIGCSLPIKCLRAKTAVFRDTGPYLIKFSLVTLATFIFGLEFLHHYFSGGSGIGFTNIATWLATFSGIVLVFTVRRESQSRLDSGLALGAVLCAIYFSWPNVRYYRARFNDFLPFGDSASREIYLKDHKLDPVFMKYVAALRKIPQVTSLDTMVYLDRNETGFWHVFPTRENIFSCQIGPLFVVSQTQRPSILGINRIEEHCERDEENMFLPDDFPLYPIRNVPKALICQQVTRYGLKRYVSVQWNATAADVDLVRVDCS